MYAMLPYLTFAGLSHEPAICLCIGLQKILAHQLIVYLDIWYTGPECRFHSSYMRKDVDAF